MRPTLTHRQSQVALMLMTASTITEIAEELDIAPRTVKARIDEACARLGLGSGRNKSVRLAVAMYRKYGVRLEQLELPMLSEQKLFVLDKICEGWKNDEIAHALGTTVDVVKMHVRVLCDRLGVWSRLELALWYEARRVDRGIPAAAETAPATV